MGSLGLRTTWRRLRRLVTGRRRRLVVGQDGPSPPPARVPIEVLAARARRLGAQHHSLPRGTSYVKVEAVRHAYDRVLAECADSLEVVHLLGVLGPGEHRDSERRRVESALHTWGLALDDRA